MDKDNGFIENALCYLSMTAYTSHFKSSPPYIVREGGGKGMTSLQQGITLLYMKTGH